MEFEEGKELEKSVSERTGESSAKHPENDAKFDAQLAALLTPEEGKGKKRRKWSRKKKLVIAGAVLAAAALVSAKLFGGGKPPAPMVGTFALAKGDVRDELVVSGPVSGTDSVDVVSNLHAEILEMPVKEGMRVEKDQILAVIDRKDVDKEIAAAQNAYDLAVATYKEKQRETESGYAKAVQDYQQAKVDFDRSQTLLQSGDVAQAEWEKTRNAMADAKRQVDLYRIKGGKPAADESYELQVENARLELERKKELLDDIELRSPITGTVVRVNSKVGRFADTVEDDKPLFSIENLDVLEMKINVSEYSIGKVLVGQPVTVRADILNGETVRGEVAEISPTGEEKGGGSTERVIPTTIRILDTDTRLIAGITAKAEILMAESKDTWVVPISALLDQEDGRFLQIVENGAVRKVAVETGVESDIEIEIKSAGDLELSEGLQIVTNPNVGLADGTLVTALPGM